MDSQSIHLGFILRQFKKYNLGSMNNQNDRLRLQKFIYLLQAHDIYLGYDYSWYLRGPYCTTLAKRGIVLEQIHESIPTNAKSCFADPVIQKRFNAFKKFIKGRESDDDYLEITSSLHVLKVEGFEKDDAVKIVHAKKPETFTIEWCSDIWNGDVQKLSSNIRMLSTIVSPEKYPLRDTQLPVSRENADLTTTTDMLNKPSDSAMYHMIVDSATDADFHLVGNNMFRPNELEPIPDMLMIDHDIVHNLHKNVEFSYHMTSPPA